MLRARLRRDACGMRRRSPRRRKRNGSSQTRNQAPRAPQEVSAQRTKGFFLTKSKLYQSAQEAANRADRFRLSRPPQPQAAVSAGCGFSASAQARALNGLSYSQLMHGLKAGGRRNRSQDAGRYRGEGCRRRSRSSPRRPRRQLPTAAPKREQPRKPRAGDSMANDPTAKTLAELGVTRRRRASHACSPRCARSSTAADVARRRDSRADWKRLRDAWLGRKSGVLTRITENWLKPRRRRCNRAVGQGLNELHAHVEQRLERAAAGRRSRQPKQRRWRASAWTSRCPA